MEKEKKLRRRITNEEEKKRPLQSSQERRKFAKGGTAQDMEEVGMGVETQSAGAM